MKTSIRLTACVTVFLCSLNRMAQQIEPSQGESVVIVGTGMAPE